MTDREPARLLPDALLERIQAEARRESRGWRRVRSLSTSSRMLLFLALVFVVELAVLIATPRGDLESVSMTRIGLGVAVLVIAAVIGSRLFLRPLQESAARPRTVVLTIVALSLLPLVFALLPPAHDAVHAHPESFAGTGADFIPRAIGCLAFGTIVAIPLVAFALLADRRLTGGLDRIALAAGAGAAGGTLSLLLHCPLVGMSHRLAGHAGVGISIALIVAAGLFVLRRGEKVSRTA